MKSRALALALAALAFGSFELASAQAAAAPTADDGQAAPSVMLRLRSGDVLWGSITSHTSDALRFRRIDTGGEVELGWSFLDPTEERELRLRFGYLAAEGDELMVEAERIELVGGDEYVGTIVNRTDEHVWIKNADGTIPLLRSRISGGSTRVMVPALDVYTRAELFQRKKDELGAALLATGKEGAAANDELAQYSERLLDYVHAVEHYTYVAELAPDYDPDRIAASLARTTAKAAVQEQADLLELIERNRIRKRYDLALESIALFPELYPNSPLLDDWNKLRDRVAKSQERDVREEVVRRVYHWTTRLARDKARKGPTYEEALAYLDETMAEELFRKVQEDLRELAPDIEIEVIQRLWSERTGGRMKRASFGLGTWLLGEDRALATFEEEKEEKAAPAKGSQAEARARLAERIDKYMKNQELTRRSKAGGGPTGDDDPNAFWNEWDTAGRASWITAYFVEYSGLFKLESVRFTYCRECGGTGVREVFTPGGAASKNGAGNQITACGTCKTIGHVRRIQYR